MEAKKATMESVDVKGPVYIRLGRSGVPVITREETPFRIGRADVLKDGNDVAIFACGQMVHEAIAACDSLKKEGINARLINLHTPKPIDRDAVVKAARETGAIVTAEEHTVMGGLGSAVAEVVSQEAPVPVKMVGVKDRFGVSGEPAELFGYFGLTAKDIVKAAKAALALKKR